MYNRCTLVEFRGVWIASVYNIDWPKTLDDPEAQKQEFIEILDKLQSLNTSIYDRRNPQKRYGISRLAKPI